jgi:UDP-2-acetamido-3-amino-2,3-dideoxy-glucuronate N-acetyltransferase
MNDERGRENAASAGVGIVGCGYWGKNLVRNFAALGALRVACDADAAKLGAVKQQHPDLRTTGSYQELLLDPAIRAVVIATPAASHHAHAAAALEAGKDAYVEKPLALTVEDGRSLVALAEKAGRILMVGHLLRYHPGVRKLKELVDGGALGKILHVYSNRLNLGMFRTEENILWSFAPHDISVILHLLGERPSRIQAQAGSYLHPERADVTVTTLRFPSGVTGHIFVSWLHPYKEQKLVVVGDRGMAVFDDVAKERKLTIYRHAVEWKGRVPVAHREEGEEVPFAAEEPLRAECQHFLRCVATRERPWTDGAEGLAVLEVLEACQRSMDGKPGPAAAFQSTIPSADYADYTDSRPRTSDAASSSHSAIRNPHSTLFVSRPVPFPYSRTVVPSNAPAPSPCSVPRSPYFAHETAVIDQPCEIGEGTRVWHFTHVMKSARIGKGCILGQNVNVDGGVIVGDNVKVQNNVSLYTGVVVEDDVFLGPSCVLTNVSNPRSQVIRHSLYEKTTLRRGCTIGANATIVCGVTIGRYAFVGAGAVVTKDVPDYALMLGNPARQHGWMSRHGHRLGTPDEHGVMTCPESGYRYKQASPGILKCLDLGEEFSLPEELRVGKKPYDAYRGTGHRAQGTEVQSTAQGAGADRG